MYIYHQIFTDIGLKNFFEGPLLGLRQFLEIESPLKIIEKAFFFTIKALFVLKIIKICLEFWSCTKTA